MEREIINPTNEELCDMMCGKPEYDVTDWELKYESVVRVTMQDIDDILTTAFEGGITYWCDEVKVDGDYLGEYASEQVSRGGALYLHEMEDDRYHYLCLNDLLYGLKLYLQNKTDIILDGGIDTCNIDADIADQIVQYAIFKEIVYG